MNRCFYQSGGFGSWVGVLHGGGFEVHSFPFWVSVSFLGFGAPLSLSLFADDEAYALHHGDASSTSPSTSLRPKKVLKKP